LDLRAKANKVAASCNHPKRKCPLPKKGSLKDPPLRLTHTLDLKINSVFFVQGDARRQGPDANAAGVPNGYTLFHRRFTEGESTMERISFSL